MLATTTGSVPAMSAAATSKTTISPVVPLGIGSLSVAVAMIGPPAPARRATSIPDGASSSPGKFDQRKQHQYWIVEGYTHSSTLAYSSSVGPKDTDRYLRNSVKAVVDAYNGSIHFYLSEPDDPIIGGWRRILERTHIEVGSDLSVTIRCQTHNRPFRFVTKL